MATITTTNTPTPIPNSWNVPSGYQSFGIPRAEMVFSTQFTIDAIGVGDVGVMNLTFVPPPNYFYRVTDLSFMLTATTESDIDDQDEALLCQFRNFRTGGSEVQTQNLIMINTARPYTQSSTIAALTIQSVQSSQDFATMYVFPPPTPLPGMVLSTVGGAGDVFLTLDNPVASSDGDSTVFAYCRMLQYDVSDEFEYLLHTPVPIVRA